LRRWLYVSEKCDACARMETDTALSCVGGRYWVHMGAFLDTIQCLAFVFRDASAAEWDVAQVELLDSFTFPFLHRYHYIFHT
jgi:hypothetical protein